MSFIRDRYPVVLASLIGASILPAQVVIDHRYTNTDAQSLIGLPMGSHKTIVDKQGNLKWSQWSLKRKPIDTPIGFSSQMDGELAIQPFSRYRSTQSQHPATLSRPLSVHRLVGAVRQHRRSMNWPSLSIPMRTPGEIPTATSGAKAFDVVRLTLQQ